MLKRSELADFLRSRREALRPEACDASIGRRRRTPGLRREEVAARAGISSEWYVKLEQGRTVTPSLATVDALALALRLDGVERDHLRLLACGERHDRFARETVPEDLRRLVRSLSQPAYISGRRWDVLAWNEAADAIFEFSRLAEPDRNVLLLMLTDPAARRLFGASWASEARRMVALFRTTFDLWALDAAFVELLARLRAGAPEFAGWWEAHAVRRPTAGCKVLHHPVRGTLRFEYATFQANDDPALKLAIYSPA